MFAKNNAAADAQSSTLRNFVPFQLPQFALAALSNGDDFGAFALSDRWCRQSGPNVASLLLRAEASHRLGDRRYALEDIERALELEPDHRLLNLRLLEWGDSGQRSRAALRLIEIDVGSREQCLSALSASGMDGAGNIFIKGGRVTGWVAWKAGVSATLAFDGVESLNVQIHGDKHHPLATIFGQSTDIDYPLKDSRIRLVKLVLGDGEVCAKRNLDVPQDDDNRPELDCSPKTTTVIVPVYDDFEATRQCLQSVEWNLKTDPSAQLLIIEDATPNADIKELLKTFALKPRCYVASHSANRGYVGSVNRALRFASAGDVILLNSDTIVPFNFIRRMKSIARIDPTIGTINPLSNNGEFVSFPQPFRNNQLDIRHWQTIDICAAAANADVAIDIPSGTGFCLYVTRACLDAVGGLSDAFKNGYLEDADFGLRAREAGFRNVCAPAIYVAHIGSRSFRAEKAALVARNRKTLERRFPDYEAECNAFLESDPLSDARSKIEMILPLEGKRRLLIGPSRIEAALWERARRLGDEEINSLIATIERRGDYWDIKIRGSADLAPKSFFVSLNTNDRTFDFQVGMFVSRLRAWPIDRIEMASMDELPRSLLKQVFNKFQLVDLLCVEAGPEHPIVASRSRVSCCKSGETIRPCAKCDHDGRAGIAASVERWLYARSMCDRVVGLDELSRAACDALQGVETISAEHRKNVNAGARSAVDPVRRSLAIILPQETPAALGLLLALGDRISELQRNIFVFGRTSIDERLIAKGLFVTGPIAQVEIKGLVDRYHIGRYLLPYRQSNYWLLQIYQKASPAPSAFFDWSMGAFRGGPGDLKLDPRICDAKAASAICDWSIGTAGETL